MLFNSFDYKRQGENPSQEFLEKVTERRGKLKKTSSFVRQKRFASMIIKSIGSLKNFLRAQALFIGNELLHLLKMAKILYTLLSHRQ